MAEISLAQQDFDAARDQADRAVSIYESNDVSPEPLAYARFVLARALWPDRSQRDRSRTLAEQARDVYADLGDSKKATLDEVEAWLADRDVEG